MSFSITRHFEFLLFALLVCLTLYHPDDRKKVFINGISLLLLATASFLFTENCVKFPKTSMIKGTAYFHIESLTYYEGSHAQGWIYRGKIKKFIPEDKSSAVLTNLPCHFFIKKTDNRPPANKDYLIDGLLRKSHSGYKLKVENKNFGVVKGSWSLAEWRFQIKNTLKEYLKREIKQQRPYQFLTGIFIGEFHDQLMMRDFNALGLQHIMAISGFHFSLIAGFFGMILRIFFSPKNVAFLLIIILACYFLLIGPAPSMERAFIAASLVMISQIIERKSSAVNNLGIALIILLISNPSLIFHLGFQFSFLATAAILLLMKPIDEFLKKCLPSRDLKEISLMPFLDQHGLIILNLTRKAISLTLAVHITTVPLILYHFHKFPLISLLYNLFFPFLVAISLFLLLSGIVLCFIPWLSSAVHFLNAQFTQKILIVTENPSPFFSHTFYIESLPGWFLLSYYLFLFGIALRFFQKENDLFLI